MLVSSTESSENNFILQSKLIFALTLPQFTLAKSDIDSSDEFYKI